MTTPAEGIGLSWEALGAIGALILGLGAIGGQIGTWYRTSFLTEEHGKKLDDHDQQLADIMGHIQKLSDSKAGRDEMRAAVADLKDTIKGSMEAMERKVDASDSRVERNVASQVGALTSQMASFATSVTSQFTTLTTRIDAMMQRSRAHTT